MTNKWRVESRNVSVNTTGHVTIKYVLTRGQGDKQETRLDQYDSYLEAQRIADFLNEHGEA